MRRAQVELASRTQAGHRHQVEGLPNEDAVWVTDVHPRFDALLLVADGMGGHPRPREASRAAVEAARAVLTDSRRSATLASPEAALRAALRAAHLAVRELGAATDRKPPGTTLSAVIVAADLLHVAHVGDGSVFLVREGVGRRIAGGEERRDGNRPAQFLGQEDPLEPEVVARELCAGDRVMVCTDGLTRYFGDESRALTDVLARPGVAVGALAGQLTAHSRPDDYDDDTTVALVEVAGFYEAPDAPPAPARESQTGRAPRRPSLGPPVAAGAALAALLAGAFWLGRLTAPPPPPPAPTPAPAPAPPAALRKLPAGNLVLYDELNRRLFVLATRPQAPVGGVTRLQAFRVGEGGRLEGAGIFRYDAGRSLLILPDDTSIPVKADLAAGALRVLRAPPPAPEVKVRSRPGAPR
jgi:serine/threonine protein phosphatase PrpC